MSDDKMIKFVIGKCATTLQSYLPELDRDLAETIAEEMSIDALRYFADYMQKLPNNVVRLI